MNHTFEYLEDYSLLSSVFLGCQKHGKFSYFLIGKRVRWGGEARAPFCCYSTNSMLHAAARTLPRVVNKTRNTAQACFPKHPVTNLCSAAPPVPAAHHRCRPSEGSRAPGQKEAERRDSPRCGAAALQVAPRGIGARCCLTAPSLVLKAVVGHKNRRGLERGDKSD